MQNHRADHPSVLEEVIPGLVQSAALVPVQTRIDEDTQFMLSLRHIDPEHGEAAGVGPHVRPVDLDATPHGAAVKLKPAVVPPHDFDIRFQERESATRGKLVLGR